MARGTVATMTREPDTRLLERYDEAVAALPDAPDWLKAVRSEGLEAFRRVGLPHAKVERWKYTQINDLVGAAPIPAALAPHIAPDAIPTGALEVSDAVRIVLVNGRFAPALSNLSDLPKGLTVASLAGEIARGEVDLAEHVAKITRRIADLEDYPFLALNSAHADDGAVVRIAAGALIERPIHLIFVGASAGDPVMSHPRNLIVAEPGSVATVYESHVAAAADSAYFSNLVTEIVVGEKARLEHYSLQNEAPGAFHVSAINAELAEGAVYDSFVLHAGGHKVRRELRTYLGGRHVEAHLNGAYMVRSDHHVDNTTFIDHAYPQCVSKEVFKGVLDDRARGVFQGKILVRKPAQQTDGHQLSQALLLSRGAEIDTKPELEIYADDVKCSHGATVGELEENQLFYLMARGIDRQTARGMLIEAFLTEAVETIGNEAARDVFRPHIVAWLGGSAATADQTEG